MKEYIDQSKNISRVLGCRTKASNQIAITDVLQTYRDHSIEKCVCQFDRKRRRRPKGTIKSSQKRLLSIPPAELYKEFVLREDAEKISKYTIDHNCAISIRQTGSSSLARLRQGAATKPHTILDKSLKAKTAPLLAESMDIDDRNVNNLLRKVLKALHLPLEIEGHVPHWNMDTELGSFVNGIDGFYLTEEGIRYCRQDKQLRKGIIDNYLKLQGCRQLIRKNKNWHQFFITGDYDVHDIASFSKFNRNNQIVQDRFYPRIPKATDIHSPVKAGDTGMLRDLNEEMGYGESQRRFQHGAQVNYIYFAQDMGENINEVLMYPDFPVALCDRGRWSIVKDEQQLQNWYDEVRLVYTWQERE